MIKRVTLCNLPVYSLTLAILGLSQGLQAQEVDYELDPFSVETTRLDASWGAFSSAQTVQPALLDRMEDSMQELTGSFFNQPLGFAGNTELIVRGGEANFTNVRIEGIDVNNPTDSRGGGFAYATIAGLPISTIELVKGSTSSISGSGAVSGALSMQLGSVAPLSYISAEAGSFGFEKYSGLTSLGDEKWQTQVGYAKIQEDSRYEGHLYESEGGFLKTAYTPARDKRLALAIWSTSTEQVRLPEDSGGWLYAESDALETLENDATGMSLRYLQAFQNGAQLSIVGGHFSNDVLSNSPQVPGGKRNPFGVPANRFDDHFKSTQLEGSYRFGDETPFDLAVGFSYQKEDAKSDSVVDLFPGFSLPSAYDVIRDKTSAFVESAYEIVEGQFLHYSGRYDNVTDVDAQWSNGVKYGLRLPAIDGELYASYREAFKAPSLFALNNAMVGNSSLKPETSDTLELGISGNNETKRVGWKLAVFSQHYSNLIDLSETTQTLTNLSKVDILGMEALVNARISDRLACEAALSLLTIDLPDTDEILRHRPEQQLRTSLLWALNDQNTFRLSYLLTGKRWDSSIPTGNVELEADHELSISWEGQYHEAWSIALELRNVLAQNNEVLIGYEKPETSAQIRVAWIWAHR